MKTAAQSLQTLPPQRAKVNVRPRLPDQSILPKHPGGRPTKYKPEFAEQVYRLALLSITDIELAGFFGVSEKTLINWAREHPEFLQAIARGREAADANVAERLYHRAMGYSHEAVKIFWHPDNGDPVYAPYTQHYPPDTNAASLWLRNRQPKLWRDRQTVEHTGRVDGSIEHTGTVNVDVRISREEFDRMSAAERVEAYRDMLRGTRLIELTPDRPAEPEPAEPPKPANRRKRRDSA